MQEKPLNPRKKELCRKLDKLLDLGPQAKRSIEAHLIPGCKPGKYDRQVREVIATVKQHRALINLSSKNEVRKAEYYSDYDDAQHQIAENISRANEILKGNKPLEEFCALIEAQMRTTRG